jgi:hypothetical protein
MKNTKIQEIDSDRAQDLAYVIDRYQQIEDFKKSAADLKEAHAAASKAYMEAIKAFMYEELFFSDQDLIKQEHTSFAWEFIDFYARPADVDEASEKSRLLGSVS